MSMYIPLWMWWEVGVGGVTPIAYGVGGVVNTRQGIIHIYIYIQYSNFHPNDFPLALPFSYFSIHLFFPQELGPRHVLRLEATVMK